MADATTSTLTAGAGTMIQIYNGIIAGGTLGTPIEFLAKPDDIIQSMDELRTAATQNLAAFILSIPGRFFYEIGIQASYTTEAGFTQRGAPVKIITGYTAKTPTTAEMQAMINAGTWVAGTKVQVPKYKTVYNKFAIMKIGIRDAKGKSVKLATIVLGPVNAQDFNPSTGDLTGLQQSINTGLFTSDVSAIKNIATSTPVTVSPPATAPAAAAAPQTTPATQTPATVVVPASTAESLQNFMIHSEWAKADFYGLSYDESSGTIRNSGGGLFAYTRVPTGYQPNDINYWNSTEPMKIAYNRYLSLGGRPAAASSTSGTPAPSGASAAPSSTTTQAPASSTTTSAAPQYTFTPTPYGTIEVRKDGVLFTTATVATARIYGYTG